MLLPILSPKQSRLRRRPRYRFMRSGNVMDDTRMTRKFGKKVSIDQCADGFLVLLDGQKVRTPGHADLLVPTRRMAELIAEEWRKQGPRVMLSSMPVTRSAYTAIDVVRPHRDKFVSDLAAYGSNDLVCYRVETPYQLRLRQDAGWNPLVDWIGTAFGVSLTVTEGISHVAQPAATLRILSAEVAGQDNFGLTALHDLVVLSGSLVVALAVIHRFRTGQEAWKLSRIDEDWQIEHWGDDLDARMASDERQTAFLHAAVFHALSRRASWGGQEAGLGHPVSTSTAPRTNGRG